LLIAGRSLTDPRDRLDLDQHLGLRERRLDRGPCRRLCGEDLDALRFNPWNTGGGMEPAGWLNGALDRAYKLSQGAWRRTRRDGAALQDSADRELERLELPATSTR
jgi:hypothetical protein